MKKQEIKLTDNELADIEMKTLLNDDSAYSDNVDDSAKTKQMSGLLKIWKQQNTSVLCAKLGKSLAGHSTYAFTQGILRNTEITNGHNTAISELLQADVYRVSLKHFYGEGMIEKDNFGLFAIASESRVILRVKLDKQRTTKEKPVWVTTSEQYPFLHGGELFQNIVPGRIIVRGLRQLGVNHYADNKENDSDVCLTFALDFNAKDANKATTTPLGHFARA